MADSVLNRTVCPVMSHQGHFFRLHTFYRCKKSVLIPAAKKFVGTRREYVRNSSYTSFEWNNLR
jgi:hypothetical protein